MRFFRSIIAACVFLAWLGAGAHMALAHGGVLCGSHVCEVMHDGESTPAKEDHHHHDCDELTAAQSGKFANLQFLAPQWVALDQFVAELAASARAERPEHERPAVEDSPPDERMSGWLLVCRTALPVRGPSFAP